MAHDRSPKELPPGEVVGINMLERFVTENPGCRVGRPKLAVAAYVCGGALLAVLTGVVVGLMGLSARAPEAIVVGAALVAIGAIASRGWIGKLSAALELMRRGHACYAIGKTDLLLIDTHGNTVVIAYDEVQSLSITEGEARLRVSSDLQGVVYAILFDLFDEDGPGPHVDPFFDALAPLLRAAGAEIDREDPGEEALYV